MGWRATVERAERRGEPVPQWAQYLYAAHRKVRVANYHLGKLLEALAKTPDVVTIAVQAHFEGVIMSDVAASYGVAGAVNHGLRVGLKRRDVNLKEVLDRVSPDCRGFRGLRRWHDAPIAADARAIRNLAAHHHYVKSPTGERIEVQPPPGDAAYHGSRELVEYCSAVVDHLGRLEPLLDGLAERFGSSGASS
jgi:hypothetical protein